MPTAHLTPHLQRFFDVPTEVEVEGATVREVIDALEARWPGIAFYLTDETGRLRQHVAVWVDGTRLADTEGLGDAVAADGEVHILQALSGG